MFISQLYLCSKHPLGGADVWYQRILDLHPFLGKIFNSLPTGVYICDAEERIVFINDAAAAIDGLETTEVIGKKIYQVYDEHESAMRKVLSEKQDVDLFVQIYSEGKTINQICDGFLIQLDGEIAGACSLSTTPTSLEKPSKVSRLSSIALLQLTPQFLMLSAIL